MKLLLGFLLGVACGAALMFQLMYTGWFAPLRRSSLPSATALTPPPTLTPATSTPAPPVTVAAASLSVVTPATDMHVALPAVTASTLRARAPAPVDTVVGQGDLTGGTLVDVPDDVPASAVHGLLIPVQGVRSADLRDTFTQARSSNRVHDAIDIVAARGTPVRAVNAGRVVKLFTSKPGGLTVYQFDPSEHVIYYYAHLDRYAPGLAEGQQLQRGDPIGSVGSTGNASADAPHLHFEVQLLGPEKQWWHATSINPYGRFAGQP